jgi:tRNA threonylcarbamoyladenosine biosynthesis protein TsaB
MAMIQPLILLLETATEVCSVGLCRGEELLSIRETSEGQDHAAKITCFISEVMEEAGCTLPQIDAVAVSDGPGSYTSLRIGASTAKGICYALQKPLVVTDTLACLAFQAAQVYASADIYFPMIDARRMEVYGAIFDAKLQKLKDTAAQVISVEWWDAEIKPLGEIAICGNGAEKVFSLINGEKVVKIPLHCSAEWMIPKALEAFTVEHFSDIAYYTPCYLKPPNITLPKKTV